MAVTQVRIGPAQTPNTATTVYTVPSGARALIRDIHIFNPSGSSVNFTMSIGADAAGTRLYDAFPIGTISSFDRGCYIELAAGEVVQLKSGTGSTIVHCITVDEITA